MVGVGSQVVAVLGFVGVAHKVASAERRRVIAVTRERVGTNMKVLVGVRAHSAAGVIELAVEAKDLGTDSVFVAQIDVQNYAVLYAFYTVVAER